MEALHIEDTDPGISHHDFCKIISDCFTLFEIDFPTDVLKKVSHKTSMRLVNWLVNESLLTNNIHAIELLNFAGVAC